MFCMLLYPIHPPSHHFLLMFFCPQDCGGAAGTCRGGCSHATSLSTQNNTDLVLAWRRWGLRAGCSPSPGTTPTGRGSDNARFAPARSRSGPVRSPPLSSFHFAAVARTKWQRTSCWKTGSEGRLFDLLQLGSPARLPAAEDAASLEKKRVTGWGRGRGKIWKLMAMICFQV